MKPQKQIIKILAANGISPSDINFFGNNGEISKFRYMHWKKLPNHALEELQDYVIEDLYEDDNGDDEKGRPITIYRYSYDFNKTL